MALPSHSSSFSYHVFLSFRGTDTRYGFTGNLYKALDDKGIHTFFDEEELRRGDEITPALENAIQESRIAIIVLSKDYASSSFCLDELSTIIHSAQSKGLLVIPVFYKVDPSDVRHQRGSYEDALTKHERRFPDKLQKWKMALRKVADLSGYHFKQGDTYEYKFIGSIVDTVSNELNHLGNLHVGGYLVGLESRMQEVMKLLDGESDDVVFIVGIHGMGGVGKSTLAQAVYNNLIAEKFDGSCYLGNVREKSKKHGLEHLQRILLQEILGDEKIKVASVERGASMIPQRLQRKKVLLVLDDVDNLMQLEAIVSSPEWFGPGSRVIITTRDQKLLACHQVNRIYELKTLNYNDARQLLTWKAFKKEKADPTYVEVLDRVLKYASGLPLALEVIGSHLFGMSVEEWKSAIEGYERILNHQILDMLKISFNALEKDEKRVFLDISCCFKGYTLEKLEDILRARYGNCMKSQIRVLVEKSLIKMDYLKDRQVTLHDLIEEMGKAVVRQESPENDPGEQSRLWLRKDIIQVLEGNTGTRKIEIIHLDDPISDKEEITEWDGNAFKEMKRLEILIIKNGKFSQGPKCLPNSLKVLEWWGYPSNCLPSHFRPKNLVMCNLPRCCFTSFKFDGSSKMFKNLTVLRFDECKSLRQIPDVSDFLNLEKLSFNYCDNLVTVHESIGRLGKVKIISANGCSKLVSFPPIHLTSLEYFNLSSTGLESFPEILGKMENIRSLHLSDIPIKELPVSFVNLVGLKSLHMHRCGSAVKLPSSILVMPELTRFVAGYCKGMKWVKEEEKEERMGLIVSSKVYHRHYATRCNLNDDYFSIGFTRFADVGHLDLSYNNFTFIPECIKECQSLRSLDVSNCVHLQEIRGVPPKIKFFRATNCKSLTSLTTRMFINKKLYDAGMNVCALPGAWIPRWFDHQSKGPSTSFWFRNEVSDVLCFTIAPVIYSAYVFMNGRSIYYSKLEQEERLVTGHTFIFRLELGSTVRKFPLEKEWNHVEVRAKSDCKVIGIHVWGSSEDNIRFMDPCRKRKLDDVLNPFKLENKGRLQKRRRFV